jgi:mRNA interferase HigB
MRIISKKTLREFWRREPLAKQPLEAWYDEASKAAWRSSSDLKQQYGKASIITSKRVVFNIHGNRFRLVVDIEYRLQIIFIVWAGTHGEYDKLDVKKLHYVKTHTN